MNSAEEQRLADLLKQAVPEPPRELSAGEIQGQGRQGAGRQGPGRQGPGRQGPGRQGPGRRSAWSSWGVPSLAAVAMLAVGVFVGVAHHSAGASPPAAPAASAAPAGNGQPGLVSASPSPLASASRVSPSARPTPAVTVPNAIGETAAPALKSMEAAGFRVVMVRKNAPAPVSAGMVWSQTPAAGEVLPPGSEVTLFVTNGGSGAAPEPTASANASSCDSFAAHTFTEVTSATLNPDGSLTLTAHPVTVTCGGPDDMHYNVGAATETGAVTPTGAVEMLTSPGSEQTVPHADVSTRLRADQWGRIFMVTGPLTRISALQEQYHP